MWYWAGAEPRLWARRFWAALYVGAVANRPRWFLEWSGCGAGVTRSQVAVEVLSSGLGWLLAAWLVYGVFGAQRELGG